MLPLELWLTIVAGISAACLVQAKPTFRATVDLMECPSTVNSTMEHCATVCQPVQVARETCEGTLDCTCLHAPPETVEACLQCHLDTEQVPIQKRELELNIPVRLARYLFVCNGISPSIPKHDATHRLASSSDSWTSETADRCVFGLPDVVMSDLTTLDSSLSNKWQNPWFLLLVVVLLVFYVVDSRRKAA